MASHAAESDRFPLLSWTGRRPATGEAAVLDFYFRVQARTNTLVQKGYECEMLNFVNVKAPFPLLHILFQLVIR